MRHKKINVGNTTEYVLTLATQEELDIAIIAVEALHREKLGEADHHDLRVMRMQKFVDGDIRDEVIRQMELGRDRDQVRKNVSSQMKYKHSRSPTGGKWFRGALSRVVGEIFDQEMDRRNLDD